jgi:hypothetical protein
LQSSIILTGNGYIYLRKKTTRFVGKMGIEKLTVGWNTFLFCDDFFRGTFVAECKEKFWKFIFENYFSPVAKLQKTFKTRASKIKMKITRYLGKHII